MSVSSVVSNIVISEDSASEQEEIKKASRMTLKEVKNVVSTLKENFDPRKPLSQPAGKDLPPVSSRIAAGKHGAEPSEPKRCKMVEQLAKATQTVSEVEHNLTGEDPTEDYWATIAEKRRLALQEALDENAQLYLQISELEERLQVAQDVTQSLQSLVDTMVEMLNEEEGAGKADSDASKKVDDSGLAQSLCEEGGKDDQQD
uniref:Geminin n=1 Tax=Anopheles farauti TaxID=69004 RepID=A0A182Q1B5_9DIPT